MPLEMSDLRIVLLGKSVSENSQVGNFILGRAAFDSESPSDDVGPYSDRVRGKHVTVVNTPLLLNPDLSLRHITQAVKECLSLSAPGPHVIILVLKPDECSREEKACIEILLSCFSDSVFQHTLVLTTQEPDRAEPTEVNDVLKEIIKKCSNRHNRLERNSTPAGLIASLQEIVQENDGCYLNCNKCGDFTTEATERASVAPVPPAKRGDGKTRMPLEMSDLRIVLLGKSVSENSQVGNFILGRAAFDSESPSDDVGPYSDRVRGKHVTVVNTPLLLNPDLSLRHITQAVKECLSLSAPGPHVIILVLKPDECSREEKACIEILLSCFSDSVFQHTLVLTTQEPDRAEPTEVNDVLKEIIKKCSNRHNRLERNSTPAGLIASLQEIVQENDGCYLNCNKCGDFTTEATERA
ncbi:GTPase IMAP family member 8-like [Labeo rohita]|uniref:GTPase IMAP family member 8-like n=1 Tax=Labeo rohita TaxID=84645 RepID=UPI0021E25ED1|nr:GTPase IMAP family member 8-like [Labeo rohita]